MIAVLQYTLPIGAEIAIMNDRKLTLSSEYFELNLDTFTGGWGLKSFSGEWHIEAAFIEFTCLSEGMVYRKNLLDNPEKIETIKPEGLPFDSDGIRIHKRGEDQVRFHTDIVLHDQEPFCFMRVSVENLGKAPVRLASVNYFGQRNPIDLDRHAHPDVSAVFTGQRQRTLRFFGQGWQSWSYAGVLGPDDRFPRSKLGPLSGPMQLCWGLDHPKERGRFISDFYGAIVDHQTDTGLLLGFVTQSQAFGRLEVDLNHPAGVRAFWQDLESIYLSAGAKFECDWACIHEFNPHQPHPLDQYMAVVSSANRNGDLSSPVSGWCSWYYYGQDISEAGLHEQLEWMAKNKERLPLDLFLIDDGYQQKIGDWQRDIRSFPEPLKRLGSRIKARSFDAGIWMAPLITLGDSDLAKSNPDWVLRDSKGKAVNAGFGWGQFFYALDGSHPDFRRELKKWIAHVVSDWGFNFLKLDFLYAGALLGRRYDNTKTGAMVLREVLEEIRLAAGEKTALIGCGCPLGTGVGLVDSMRISPDVSANWRGRYKGISLVVNRDPGFPSAWNAIRNTYFRAHQHGHWWLNDPDCLILRDDHTRLNEDEVRTLATMVSLCGGVVIDSDELSSLAAHRAAMFARLIPPINQRPEQPALFCPERPPMLLHRFSGEAGDWTLAAVFNFEDSATEFVLASSLLGFNSEDELIGFNYWDQHVRMFQGESWNLGMIPAHGVGIWALRMPTDRAAWVGDSIHISQGHCISTWEIDRGVLRATVSSGRVGNERIWLRIPGEVASVSIDRERAMNFRQEDDILTFEIQLSTMNLIEVRWN